MTRRYLLILSNTGEQQLISFVAIQSATADSGRSTSAFLNDFYILHPLSGFGLLAVDKDKQRQPAFIVQMTRLSTLFLVLVLFLGLLSTQILAQDVEIAVESSADTPLMAAASIGDVDGIRKVLAGGAHIDEKNAAGFTAAHQAVVYRHLNALEEVRL